MSKNEGMMIKELYEKKFLNKQLVLNSYNRVKQIQKKINENTNKKHEKLSYSLKLKDHI
jgi:hypothetical protein